MDAQLLIGGRHEPASGNATYDRMDPVTKEVATKAAAATAADAVRAADAAAKAFESWSETGPGKRRALLMKAAELMDQHRNEFADLMTRETGATNPWGEFNVYLAGNILREAAAMTTQISGEVIPSDKPGNISLAMRYPVGVCLGIAPWNAPVILGTRAIAMALACGNTVVLKASEQCPGTHGLIGAVLHKAGFPDGVVNVVSNAPSDAAEIVKALINHPAVARINFTGSTRIGKVIAELAAKQLKPVLLELGGKAPLVVLDDADLDEAVNAAIFGAYLNQGQICMSTERIIVDERIADAFVAKMAERAKKLPSGDPRGHVVLGSLVNMESADHVEALVKDAVAKGAVLVAGGKRDGTIMDATLLDKVTAQMRIYSEESFGPAKSIIRVKGVEEAIRVANDTEYGLSSAVFGKDIRRAMEVAKKIRSGICHINGPTVADEPQMPFGGVKGSGYGRFGGKAGINEFTETRWITIESTQHYPF